MPRERLRLPAAIAALSDRHLMVVPATQLALTHIGRPVPNAALLGGFAALTGLVPIDAVTEAIRARFPVPVAQGNIAAARTAYDLVHEALLATAGEERTHG